MKNIYQDDFSPDTSKNESPSPKVNKAPANGAVRPARQAPPPIKKSAVTNKQPVAPDGAQYPFGYPPPGYYPQPVFYQPDPSQPQPYPVYYAPYPPVQFPPQPASAPAPSVENTDNEAGTRVLFQSDDFDKREDTSDEGNAYPEADFGIDFDISEERLSSAKRAPAPTKNLPTRFKVDEMEMGTYEFNIMTAGQSSKSKNILTPDEELRQMGIQEESFIDEVVEDYNESDDVEIEDVPQKEEKKLPTSEIIRRTILGVSIVAIVIACGSLLNEYRLHKQNESLMNDLSDMIITEPSTTEPTTSAPDNVPTDKTLQLRFLQHFPLWKDLLA